MLRSAALSAGVFLLGLSEVIARCPYIPIRLAEIEVESCAPILDENNLVVTGKLVGFIEIDERSDAPLAVTRVDDWEAGPSDRFVWTQPDNGIKDCEYIETKKPLFVSLQQPCCDVLTYEAQPDGTFQRTGKFSCLERLKEIFEIDRKFLPEDAHNKSLNSDAGKAGAG